MDIATKKYNLIHILNERRKGTEFQRQEEEVWKTVSNLKTQDEKLEWIKNSIGLSESELQFYNTNNKITSNSKPSLMEQWLENI